jgi:hypothetical protein
VSVGPYNEIPIARSDLHAYFRSLVKKMRSNINRQARRLFVFGTTEIVLAEGAQAIARSWPAAQGSILHSSAFSSMAS